MLQLTRWYLLNVYILYVRKCTFAHIQCWRKFAKCRFAHFPSIFSAHVDTYVYRPSHYGRSMLVSTLYSFYSISAQRLTRSTTKSFSRNYIELACKVMHIAGSNLTSPAEHSASVSMTIFLALCDRNMELHKAVCWALSFSRCTSLDSRMFSPSTGSVIMSMRTTPSYTLTSLVTILRSLLTEYAGALLT